MVSFDQSGVDRSRVLSWGLSDRQETSDGGAVTVRTPRRTVRLAVYAAVTALALSACAGDDGGDDDGVEESADEGAEDGDGVEAMPGLEGCGEDPLNCNSGERGEGGEITFLVNQGHDSAYNSQRTEGNSVYLVQMEAGIFLEPAFQGGGGYSPAGDWEWNLDLLASEPEVVSEDPLTVNYVIRDEAVWSDGEPINVDDVRWLWYHNSGDEELCTACNPADTSLYAPTASIEASDEAGKDITITYEDGFTHPEWFSRGLIMYPAHIATEQAGDWENDPDAMTASSEYFLNNPPTVFSGPYVVESWTADETQVLVPNENWYGETQPTLDTVVKQVIPDQPSWVPAMQNEEIHGGSPASFTPDVLEQLGELPGVYTGVGSFGAVWEHVDMNMDVLDDAPLRQAIFTAIDTGDARERIWGALGDLGFEMPPLRQNHIFPQASEFFEDHLSDTGYGTGDVEAARAILEEAGYTGFESGGTLTDPDGEPVKDIRFRFLAGNENRNTFVQLSQSYLAEIGITVTPEAIPPDQLGTVLTEADYDIVIFGWSGSPLFAVAPHQYWHSEGASNFGHLSNPEVDELVTAISAQPTQEEAAALANEAVQLVMEEAYVLPLWDTPNMAFVSDQYVNIRDNHANSERAFYNIEHWGVSVQ